MAEPVKMRNLGRSGLQLVRVWGLTLNCITKESKMQILVGSCWGDRPVEFWCWLARKLNLWTNGRSWSSSHSWQEFLIDKFDIRRAPEWSFLLKTLYRGLAEGTFSLAIDWVDLGAVVIRSKLRNISTLLSTLRNNRMSIGKFVNRSDLTLRLRETNYTVYMLTDSLLHNFLQTTFRLAM